MPGANVSNHPQKLRENGVPTAGNYRWWVVAMLWLVCLFNYADRQAVFSVFDPLKKEMHLTDVELSFVGSAFMWVYAIVLPFAGLIGDRVSRKTLILGGLVFWSFVTMATAWSTQFWHLVLCRALEGLGEAFYFPASMAMISDYHGKATRSRAMAFHQSSVYAGTIFGGSVAGYCAQHYGWRSGFYLFGGLGILLAVVLMVFLREPARGAADDEPEARPATPGELARGVPEVLGTPMVLVLLVAFIGTVFVGSIFLTWMPTYLKREFGMDLAAAGTNATLWLQTASALGAITGGILADRWAARYRGGRVLVQAVGLFVGAPLVYVAGGTTSVTLLLLALCGFGFCKGLYDSNTWAALYEEVRPERRSTALGLVNGIGWLLGGAPAPTVIALSAARIGFGPSLGATAAIYLFCGLLLVVGRALFQVRARPAPAKPVAVEEGVP
jgi:MFS family permease